jgi:opacity protein-like surface antigen
MKKILLMFVVLLATLAAKAQNTEVAVSYGGYTQMDAMDCHQGGSDVNTAWGSLNAGVNFNVAPNFWIGPSYSFSSTSRKGLDDNHFYYHTIMINGRYNYYSNSIVTVYAHAGLGSVISHQTFEGFSKDKAYLAFQVNPIGAQVELTPAISMFGEAGFGAQGLVQVGLKFNL